MSSCASPAPPLCFRASQLPVEVDHQLRSCLVFHFPERRNDALGSRFDKRIDDIRDSLFADRADARIAGGERYKVGVEWQITNLAYLKQSVVAGRRFGRKDEGGAIREFRIGISMKSQMYDFILTEGRRLKSVSVAWSPSRMVLGCGRSAAMVSTSLRLSGRATSWRRSGPEIARRMLAISVVGGGLEIQAATPTYGSSSCSCYDGSCLSRSSTVPDGATLTNASQKVLA